MSHWSDALPSDTCREAREWCLTQPSYEAAWETCERGDWLLWLARQLGVDRRHLALAACACARLALPRVPAGEERPRIAIETAEAWARGAASLVEVRAAADAAYYAAAYYASAAARAAAAAAAVAYASAAYATAAANAAANASADAADAASAAASAACTATLAECARLVRDIVARPDLGGAS